MQTNGQTDRRTDILRQHSPRYAQHRTVKTQYSGVNADGSLSSVRLDIQDVAQQPIPFPPSVLL